MNKKQLKDLRSLVGQVVNFKPKEPYKQPEKAPSKKQLEEKWRIVKG